MRPLPREDRITVDQNIKIKIKIKTLKYTQSGWYYTNINKH